MKRTQRANFEEAYQRVGEILQQELANGSIEDYGKEHLYVYLRSKYNIIGR